MQPMNYAYHDVSYDSADAAVAAMPGSNEVIEALQRMLASPDFPASQRNRRFLQRVVRKSLQGERTKACEIATEVFGRPGPLDATSDPIVRIEAAKLRRDLETYYLKSGKHERVRISLPKGRYFSRFAYVTPGMSEGAPDAGQFVLLRAALLGLRAADEEARQAWDIVLQEFPDFHFNSQAHGLLGTISGQDHQIRGLLLEGLRRAANADRNLMRLT
jgi:hypothetical protein